MITANQIECLVPALTEAADVIVKCTMTDSSGASAWDVGSTIANWVIMAIAGWALVVSVGSRRDSAEAMEQTLELNKETHKEMVAENQAAVQAQLNATRAAAEADLAERKNSRELDITAEYVTALDRLQMTASINPDDESRGQTSAHAATDLLAAASRFDLFVGHATELLRFHMIYIPMLENFEAMSLEDFGTLEFDRLVKMQQALRNEIVSFQRDRLISANFRVLIAALDNGNMELADKALGVDSAL